jgi:phosphate transport system substrate-binding protein
MQFDTRKAISNSAKAGVVIVVLLIVLAAIYFSLPLLAGSGTSTTSTTNTTSTGSSTCFTPPSANSSSTAGSPSFQPLTIQAGGSTFVNPVMQVWAVSFNQYSGGKISLNYQSLGSGAGITGVQAGTFSFAGSDAPHQNQTSSGGTLINIPETLGAVAIFYNIPGVTVSLNLTGSIIAKIYLEQITMWNDSSILALNPNVNASLLAHTIVPVHRSDGSGTTFALTSFFSKVSTDWNASGKGVGTSINWPASGELAGKGSAGVATYVQQTLYSVGYADSYYAFSNKLTSAAVQNQAGQFLTPSLSGINAAAAAFATQLSSDPTYSITNAPGASSYPISTFTYLLVWQKQTDANVGLDMAQLFWWIVTNGQSYGPTLYYPQLPASMVSTDENLIAQMTYNGASFICPG